MSIIKQPSHAQSTPSVSSDSETDNEYAFVAEPQSSAVNQTMVIKTDMSRASPRESTQHQNHKPVLTFTITKPTFKFLTDSGATINI